MATVLSAVQVADPGGETEFANSYAAYEALTEAQKDRVGSLRVRALARGVATPGQSRSDAGAAGSLESQARPTSIRWCGHTEAAASRWSSARRPTTSSGWTPTRDGRCSASLLDGATGADNVYRHHWSRR